MSGGARGKALAIQLIKDKKVLMVSKVSFKAWRIMLIHYHPNTTISPFHCLINPRDMTFSIYERIRLGPVTDIGVCPLANESPRN